MDRKTYCEMINALENFSQECEIIPTHYCIQTQNRLFRVRREDVKSMEYSILINTGDEVIALPYISIENISI